MQTYQKMLSAKNISIIALFAALYVFMGSLVGLVVPALRGYPAHFFRGLTMSGVAAYSRRMWSASIMGLISGLIFFAVVPAPAPYLLPSSIVAGLLYDLSLGKGYVDTCRNPKRVTLGTLVSGLGEGAVAMAILTYVGFFRVQFQVLAVIWVAALAANMLLSTLGAQVTLLLLRRYK